MAGRATGRADFEEAIRLHADTVLRVCMLYLHQRADAEDAFQDTFVRFAKADIAFANDEHRKAWLIRVATNVCKDMLRSAAYKTEQLDAADESLVPLGHEADEAQVADAQALLDADPAVGPPATRALDALRRLDERYRAPLYLCYVEGHTAVEAADILGIPVNTVYTNIARGKRQLREVLEHE